jgi:peptidoglycan/LPS O-acetylase OafA/YrhL
MAGAATPPSRPAASTAALAPISSKRRIAPLDGVRGVAILLVMIFHFSREASLEFGQRATSWIDRTYEGTAATGWFGVDLFFVLSGFLITGILWEAKNSEGYFRNFYARRILRIFPLYYVVLIAMFIVLPLIPRTDWSAPFGDQIWFWFYMPNLEKIFISGYHENTFHFATTHLWSLAVEEQFYFIWPAVVLLFSRRNLMRICALAIVTALVLRTGIRVAGITPEAAYRLMPARMDALAVGALIALAARDAGDLSRAVRWIRPVVGAALVVLIALAIARVGLHPDDAWVETIGFTALAGLFGAAVLYAVTCSAGSRTAVALSHPAMTWMGKYSYGIYIVHLPIALLLAWRVDRAGGFSSVAGLQLPWVLLFSLAAGAVSMAVAWVSWNVMERRFLQLKDRFAYQPPPAEARDA